MVQRHDAIGMRIKCLYDRYASVSEMISVLGWPTLESMQMQHPENCHDVQNYEQLVRCTH